MIEPGNETAVRVFATVLGFLSIYLTLSPYVLGFGLPLPWRRQRGGADLFSARECWMVLTVAVLSLITGSLVLLMAWTGADHS